MMESPFSRFTDAEVRDILRSAGLPDSLDEENVRRIGLTPIRTQRERVLALYRETPDVDAIFDALDRKVPKSSIRSYLCRANASGLIGSDWRQRRPRGRHV